MATAEKLTENYLTCIICSEVFTNPATLQCDHTFCKPCILKYTKTQHDASQAKSIPCPVCRQLTKVAISDGPVDEWVNQLKPSRIIQGLIDDFGEIAEGNDGQRTPRPFLCKTHATKQVKLFCRDCKQAICHLCCSIDHRQCKKVVTFEEALPEIKSSVLARKKRLDEIKTIRTTILTKQTSKMNAILEESTKIESEIKAIAQLTVDLIREKENMLLGKLREKQTNRIEQLKVQLNSNEMAIQIIQQQSRFIDQAVISDSQSDIFDMFERCDKEFNADCSITFSPPDNIIYKCDPVALDTDVHKVQLGEVYTVKADVGRETHPVLNQSIDTSTEDDKTTPNVFDIVVMEVDSVKLLIVTDQKNNAIKSFSAEGNHEVESVKFLTSTPFGITASGKNEIIVTIPNASQMMKLSVLPQLTSLSTVSDVKSYRGIDCLDQNMLVACRQPTLRNPAVDIMDMNGQLLKSFDFGALKILRFAHVSEKGTILVTESRTNSVIFLSPYETFPQRNILLGDIGVSRPRGITTTSTGDILLVGMDVNKVIQLTESGEFVRDILTSEDGLDRPRGICMDKDGLVYVTCGQYVKVFSFRTP